MQHAHKCPSCDHVWEHEPDDNWTDEENREAHTCPNCHVHNRMCYSKYRPNERPDPMDELLTLLMEQYAHT